MTTRRRLGFGGRTTRARSGTATVEFAICLPLLMAVVLGVMEVSKALYVQNALTTAAYEAANATCVSTGTSANGETRATAVFTALSIYGATVTITPTVTSATPTGTQITVSCSAPLGSNSPFFKYLGNRTLTAQFIARRL